MWLLRATTPSFSCSLGDFQCADRDLCVSAGAHAETPLIFSVMSSYGSTDITAEVLLGNERRHRSHLAFCYIANALLLIHHRSLNIFSRDLARARTRQLPRGPRKLVLGVHGQCDGQQPGRVCFSLLPLPRPPPKFVLKIMST